jgi:2-polyprenyl-3-methyl-5-hydroxy-6-metoxy-1,4-benzoquinol methylase
MMPHPWEACLDLDRQDAGHYNDNILTPLFELIDGAPRRVLELGCAGGAFGAALKERFPGATVTGIDAGRAAVAKAATRLDRAICARLEQFDFAAAGFRPGEVDTVIAADILEHLVNPWDVLVRLKPWLAPGAQVVASIPNIRNIAVVSQLLLGGRFEYAERGLLDITHLRFFTLEEIRRLLAQTGYALEERKAILLPSLQDLHGGYRGPGPATVKLGRLTLSDVTAEELTELCAAQFLVRGRLL